MGKSSNENPCFMRIFMQLFSSVILIHWKYSFHFKGLLSHIDKVVTFAFLNIFKKECVYKKRDMYTGVFPGIEKYLILKIDILLGFWLKKFFFWNDQLVSAKVLPEYRNYVNE